MNYFKNNLYLHYKFVIKFRKTIIALFGLLFLYLSFTTNTLLTHNDDELWLQGSSELNKLSKTQHKKVYIQKLQLKLDNEAFSTQNIDNMKLLHNNLRDLKDIVKINSPLTHRIITSFENNNSSMVEAITLDDKSIDQIRDTLTNSFNEFSHFFSKNKDTLYIYIFSTNHINYDNIYIPFKYNIIEITENQNTFKDITLFSILLTTLFILFTIAFRCAIPSILGIVFIVFNTLFSISLYEYIQPDVPLHVSILLISIAVSIMDFIYIYYGWHILQTSHNSSRSIYYIIMKTIKPIFWTTFISVVGVGSLIFQNSIILQSIGFNVILSSSIAFILSFTLLIALLSYFHIKNPYIITKNSSKFFAGLEAKYERLLLQMFLVSTAIVLIASIIHIILKPSDVITKANDEVISLVFPSDGLTHESLKKLEQFHKDIKKRFEDDIIDISSSYKYAKGFSQAYNPNTPFNISNINLDFIKFDFELYGISKDVMKDSSHNVHIYIEEDGVDKNIILQWIREWDKENNTIFDDVNSLLSAAKYDTIYNMIFVVVFIVLLISLVIHNFTKRKTYSFIALIVNSTPLIWFFAILTLFDIPLSTEILVAMLIMITLSSDATIHFLYYYHRHLRPKSTDEYSLELSFVEVGTPVGIGSTILLITFSLLTFANIPTISNIGIYTIVLIALSLFADLFILPVLFIELIKSKVSSVKRIK